MIHQQIRVIHEFSNEIGNDKLSESMLSQEQIEYLLGVRASKTHPLDVLRYGHTSEGVRRFRAEQPDLLPQLVAHVRSVLAKESIFPKGTVPDDLGEKTIIRTEGEMFVVSSMEEAGVGRYERISTRPMPEIEAIHEYIRRVANPDYVRPPKRSGFTS